MSADGDRPGGLPASILEFGEELRDEGVKVGTSELLDAFAAIGEIDWRSQARFREALAATLAKSQEDRRVFELLFDRFFFRAVELAAREHDLSETPRAPVRPGGDGELSERGNGAAAHPDRRRPLATAPRARCATSRAWRSRLSRAARRARA